jgi:hypothetical protein
VPQAGLSITLVMRAQPLASNTIDGLFLLPARSAGPASFDRRRARRQAFLDDRLDRLYGRRALSRSRCGRAVQLKSFMFS